VETSPFTAADCSQTKVPYMLAKTVCSAKTSLICRGNPPAKAIVKTKTGRFSNSDLEHRKRVEKALHISEHDLRLVIGGKRLQW